MIIGITLHWKFHSQWEINTKLMEKKFTQIIFAHRNTTISSWIRNEFTVFCTQIVLLWMDLYYSSRALKMTILIMKLHMYSIDRITLNNRCLFCVHKLESNDLKRVNQKLYMPRSMSKRSCSIKRTNAVVIFFWWTADEIILRRSNV